MGEQKRETEQAKKLGGTPQQAEAREETFDDGQPNAMADVEKEEPLSPEAAKYKEPDNPAEVEFILVEPDDDRGVVPVGKDEKE